MARGEAGVKRRRVYYPNRRRKHVRQSGGAVMNREQARSRLEQTSDFTFVGGRVRITDRRVLAAIAQIKAAQAEAFQTDGFKTDASEPGHYERLQERLQAVAAAAPRASGSAA